ncbi:GNAT family N-acetyltransferase [Halobacteriovorax sp.]|uniref:GNAT family N-acetyltransferase n=1 Tax=Halobacteriovorax sp. TaxID=2020862 RepID=UPI003567FEB5
MSKKIKLQSFNTNLFYNIELINQDKVKLTSDLTTLEYSFQKEENIFKILDLKYINDDVTLICLESIFNLFPKEAFTVILSKNLIQNNLSFNHLIKDESIILPRETFASLGNIWAKAADTNNEPVEVSTNGITHPKRPGYSPGELLYKKYYSEIDTTISFRVANVENDLDNFHSWHNKKFIYNFWELNKSKQELESYLENGLKDPHSIPTILEFNNEPVGYFEFYWAKEDRLGPFYDFSNYDRGFHFLIGEESCLGRVNVDAILKATSHYSFLNDQRTQLLAGEPRSDNTRIIRYINHFECWRKEKEFDFPHKRAALLLCDRETYFQEGYPWN